MSDETQVDREGLFERIEVLKGRIERIEVCLRSQDASEAITKLWGKCVSRHEEINEMANILEPDLKGLDEDRCNWWIMAEDVDELQADLDKLEGLLAGKL